MDCQNDNLGDGIFFEGEFKNMGLESPLADGVLHGSSAGSKTATGSFYFDDEVREIEDAIFFSDWIGTDGNQMGQIVNITRFGLRGPKD